MAAAYHLRRFQPLGGPVCLLLLVDATRAPGKPLASHRVGAALAGELEDFEYWHADDAGAWRIDDVRRKGRVRRAMEDRLKLASCPLCDKERACLAWGAANTFHAGYHMLLEGQVHAPPLDPATEAYVEGAEALLRGLRWAEGRIDPRVAAGRVLGVAPDAGREDVVAAFRRAAMEHHPDRGGDPAAMRAAIEARDVLLREEP